MDQSEDLLKRLRAFLTRCKTRLVSWFKQMFSIQGDSASHEEIRDRLLAGGQVTGTNLVVLICAIVIASAGLNTGSTAVIIGAMLVSPIMGTILAVAFGVVSVDLRISRRHLVGFVFQIVVSVITSAIFFAISPIDDPTSELLARTSPTFFDVIIATFGGIAGIVGQTRSDKANNIIPGVAIATALLPPLCTCGYSIAHGEWMMLGGAAYLFLVNSYFIFLSASLVLSVLRIPRVRELTEREWRILRMRMIRNTIIVVLPSILFALSIA